MRVELIYDKDCPNVHQTRAVLMKAFAMADLPPCWTEWDRNARETQFHTMEYGSPTILVNGHDIVNRETFPQGNNCRLYRAADGKFSGIPPIDQIVMLLKKAAQSSSDQKKSFFRRFSAFIPLMLTILVPKLTCPACWPAYSGILSALGLGFINYTPYLFPLTLLFVAMTLFSLCWKATLRRGYYPFLLGLMASGAILIGKFVLDSNRVMYGGLGFLIFSSVWNACPRKKTLKTNCPQCVDSQTNKEVSS